MNLESWACEAQKASLIPITYLKPASNFTVGKYESFNEADCQSKQGKKRACLSSIQTRSWFTGKKKQNHKEANEPIYTLVYFSLGTSQRRKGNSVPTSARGFDLWVLCKASPLHPFWHTQINSIEGRASSLTPASLPYANFPNPRSNTKETSVPTCTWRGHKIPLNRELKAPCVHWQPDPIPL